MLRTTIGDYSKFLVSIMHNENLTKEMATKRLTITRNLVTPDQQPKVCGQAKLGLASCKVIAGMGCQRSAAAAPCQAAESALIVT